MTNKKNPQDYFDKYLATHDVRKLPERSRWAVLLHPNLFDRIQIYRRQRRKHRKHINL